MPVSRARVFGDARTSVVAECVYKSTKRTLLCSSKVEVSDWQKANRGVDVNEAFTGGEDEETTHNQPTENAPCTCGKNLHFFLKFLFADWLQILGYAFASITATIAVHITCICVSSKILCIRN
ncbi:unnamed protein product [Sphagnum balticum]